MRYKSKILIFTIICIVFATSVASVSATTVSVKIGSLSGGLGVTSGGIYVGNFPITITSGTTTQQTLAYCMNFHGQVVVGSTYTANLATPPDNSLWKSIGYILTWNDPAGNDNAAAANAIAFWKLIDPTVDLSAISSTIVNAGNALIVESSGKDVARQGDIMTWISPAIPNDGAISANPGQTITFTVKISSSNGVARPGVKILFNATIVSSSTPVSITPTIAITDSNGQATATVTVPTNIVPNSSIKVIASTKGVWPALFLDLSTGNPNLQNLIGLDTSFMLTLSSEVSVKGFIFVLPEGPIGALGALGSCVLAFGCIAILRKKRTKI